MALDQHGTLLKMVVMVSQHHFTGRPCWSWLSWFICLSSRLWATPPPSLTARQLSYLFVRRPEQRTPGEQAHVAQIQQHDATIAQIATLTATFLQMVRQRTPSALQTWIETVLTSGLPDLKRFATGLQQDAAVRAASSFPTATGRRRAR